MSYLNLTHKVVVITGGASGIGRSIALRMSEEGAHVVIADISSEAGAELAARLHRPQEGRRALFVRADVSDRESVETLVSAALESHGRIDVLVLGKHVSPVLSPHYEQTQTTLASYSDVISRSRTQLDWLIKELTSP